MRTLCVLSAAIMLADVLLMETIPEAVSLPVMLAAAVTFFVSGFKWLNQPRPTSSMWS